MMKTIPYLAVSISLLLNFSFVFSQDYIKFPEAGAVWTIRSIICGDQQCVTQFPDLQYLGDTIIDGIKQNKINEYLVVDTNRIVYITNLDYYNYADSVVLYDFNLNLDDTFRIYNINYDTINFVVYEIDSILINQQYRTRIKLDAKIPKTDLLDSLIWIEGVGSNFGPIYIPFLPYHEYDRILYCYKLYNKNLFGECTAVDIQYTRSHLEKTLIFPNPVIGISYLESPLPDIGLLEIYNCNGQLITKEEIKGPYTIKSENLKKGIYFYILSDKKSLKYTGKFVIQ